ncbi:MAG: hypothetical protein IJS00_05585 [Paludibacteraceae bacterium]|nr:hypothetical protein [Paludibacteraceae bacterium]
METTIEQLRTMRANLPKGNKDPWGDCCRNKRVLLHRALRRNNIGELTIGEYTVVQEWLTFVAKTKKDAERANKQLEKAIAKTAQQ